VPRRPKALTESTDYVLGAQDVLAIEVFDLDKQTESTKLEFEIEGDGRLVLPLVGPQTAAGKTVPQLRQALVAAFASFIVEPQVAVSVKDYRSHRVFVTGSVQHAGPVTIRANCARLTEVLSMAGGLGPEAGTRAIVVPENGDAIEIDLVSLLEDGDLSKDVSIGPGASVQVPRAKEYFVSGYVARPGAFLFQRPTGILRAISLAGGLDTRRASPSAVEVCHVTAKGIEIARVNVDEIARGEAPDIEIHPGDSIRAGRTLPWAIYSEIVDTALGGFAMAIGVLVGTRF
jgi:polysaccharide export outer membrane protein